MLQRARSSAWLFLCVAALCVLAALPAVAQVSPQVDSNSGTTMQAPQQPGNSSNSVQIPALPVFEAFQHGVPWRNPTQGPVAFAAPAGAHLSYFGGPIITNVQVVQVLYGSGSYNAQVAGTTSPTMGNFFADITTTGLITLFQQYNTNISGGTNQVFGNRSFAGLFQIVPSAANNGSTMDDSNIQAELLAQISAGHLPAPVLDAAGQPNTLYMIFFPPGKTITQGGSSSCVAGGFCAYHGTTSNTFNNKHVL